MMKYNPKFFAALYLAGMAILVVMCVVNYEGPSEYTVPEVEPVDTIPEFFNQRPEEGLDSALVYYNIEHRDIVYAQAVLETGNFKSALCVDSNNLFGLYDSKNKKYHTFDHWTESVKAYRDWVQYRYKPPSDYYKFLRRIKYATDKDYTLKLQEIVKNRQDDTRRYAERDTLSQLL